MQTLIDKIKVTGTTNISTIGFKTLLVILKNNKTGAAAYTGTKAEAATLKAGITVNMADNASGTNAAAIDGEYIKVRTQAGTLNAVLEVVLTEAYVASMVLPTNITAIATTLTLPANSEV